MRSTRQKYNHIHSNNQTKMRIVAEVKLAYTTAILVRM